MSTHDDPMADASLEDEGIPEPDEQPPGLSRSGGAAEGFVAPRDHARVVEDLRTTAAGELSDEPLGQRVRREEPDFGERRRPGDLGEGRVVQPDAGGEYDDTPEEVAELMDDAYGMTAEEAAVHVVEDPPGLGEGMPGYLGND